MPCGSRRHPTFPAVTPPVVPPLGLPRRLLPLGTVMWFVLHSRSTASPPCRGVLGGGCASRCRHPPCPLAIPSLPSPLSLVGVGVGGGRGGRPRCPSSGVSTSQARRWHVARHLSFCRGVGHAAWPPSSPFPLCVRSPGAPPAGACTALASLGHGRVVRPAPSPRCLPILPLCPREGGPLSAPPFLHPPPLGGRRCEGGGALSSSLRCTHVAGTRRGTRFSAGGGGGMPRGSRRRPFYPTLAPPVVPPPGLARCVPSSGTVVWFVPHPPTAASPPCRVVPGGESLFAPPLPAFPALGMAGLGGGEGRPCRLPFAARTSQA